MSFNIEQIKAIQLAILAEVGNNYNVTIKQDGDVQITIKQVEKSPDLDFKAIVFALFNKHIAGDVTEDKVLAHINQLIAENNNLQKFKDQTLAIAIAFHGWYLTDSQCLHILNQMTCSLREFTKREERAREDKLADAKIDQAFADRINDLFSAPAMARLKDRIWKSMCLYDSSLDDKKPDMSVLFGKCHQEAIAILLETIVPCVREALEQRNPLIYATSQELLDFRNAIYDFFRGDDNRRFPGTDEEIIQAVERAIDLTHEYIHNMRFYSPRRVYPELT